MTEHQCLFTTSHPPHDWMPAVADPEHERVLHLGLARLHCPGIPFASVILVCPECAQGKHRNCTRYVLNHDDDLVKCECTHE